jgi:hypothetical protein
MRFDKRCWPVAVGLALTLGCGGAVSNTGFVGAWERPLGGGHSTISIHDGDEGYRFTWNKVQGNQTVTCQPSGPCEEFVGGIKVYEWEFRAYTEAGSPHLFVEAVGRPLGDEAPARRYLDRLELGADGLVLWSHALEVDGAAPDPPTPPVKFDKISDEPL